ncbi:MAG: efflux RND transporter periplasmic adaptor subunit [bacterium]|nr:efflux RND transporter periplasmic adaptor subunit [bacterium]
MIKKIFYFLLGLCILALFAGTTWFLYQKSQEAPVIFTTVSPEIRDIEQVTVASGTIVPRKEVTIKPQIGGIIDEIYVEAGDEVQRGGVLAKIRVVPNLVNLNEAENRLSKADIQYKDAQQEMERQEHLYQQSLISEVDFKKYQLKFQNARVDLNAAQKHLKLIKEGVAKQSSGRNHTLIESTVDGMVLEVSVKEGETVVETNSFNEGTSIAFIADMSSLVFEGNIDESEVGRLQEGMEINLTVGAIEDEHFKAILEYIAPKGVKEDNGAVQFRIKAAVEAKEDVLIRAGYSANGKIVLTRKEQVLSLEEAFIAYDKEQQPYVEIEIGEQQFEKRSLELGLSDGIYVEVLSGITIDDKMKQL